MRSIKFRAWDTFNEVMTYSDKFGMEAFWKMVRLCEEGGNGIKTMQFTGLFDYNGDEIFEGDIVSHENKHSYPGNYDVRYSHISTEFGSVDCFLIGSDKARIGGVPMRNSHEWKIIGNIYENPSLLK